MGEVPGEARPFIDPRLIDQILRFLRNRSIERGDLQTGVGEDSVRQIVRSSRPIEFM
jgi:hypothetical protein